MQFRDGLVITLASSAVVKAAWRASHANTLAQRFIVGGPLKFQSSGASAKTIESLLEQSALVWELDAASADPQPAEAVLGPSVLNLAGGVADAGSTTTMLEDAAGAWSVDQHNGRWVVLDLGGANEQWRRIADTLVSPPRLQPDVAFTLQPDNLPYGIYENQQVLLTGFSKGTPQDWVAAGVVAGVDWFIATGLSAAFEIAAVAARQLTLSAPFTATLRGVRYAAHRDFTLRGYPLLRPGDFSANALVSRAIQAISDDLDAGTPPEAWHLFGAGGEPDFLNSWTAGTPSPRFYKAGSRVHMSGVFSRASAPTPPQTIGGPMHAGYRPGVKVTFAVPGGNVVSIDTDGTFRLESGTGTSMDMALVSYRAEL